VAAGVRCDLRRRELAQEVVSPRYGAVHKYCPRALEVFQLREVIEEPSLFLQPVVCMGLYELRGA